MLVLIVLNKKKKMCRQTIKGCKLEIKTAQGCRRCTAATFEFMRFACNFMLMIKVEEGGGGGILLSASYEDEMRRERERESGRGRARESKREKLLCCPALNTFTLSNKLCFLIG